MWLFKNQKEILEKEKRKEALLKIDNKIILLRKKISEVEHLEFMYKDREVVRRFYEEAKLYCYEMLNELKRERQNFR